VRVSRLYRLRVVTITLLALLFAQWSVAAYACPMLTAEVEMVGCDQMAQPLDQEAPKLCAEHCQYGQQNDQLRLPTVSAVSLVPLYTLPALPVVPLASGFVHDGRLIAPSPPPVILHCRLLI
jgi:hypothetical protein